MPDIYEEAAQAIITSDRAAAFQMSARHVAERELTCVTGDMGAKLFVSVLACEIFTEKTARRGSPIGSAELYTRIAMTVPSIS